MSGDNSGVSGASLPPADVVADLDGLSDWSRVAQGGFSTVYRAVERDLRRDVAVKVLDIELEGGSRRRFMRETETLGRLSQHPNVITVHRAGVTESGHGWIMMEFAAGGSLSDELARGPRSIDRTCSVVRDLASALDEAHRLGLVHRDVKPANVFVTAFGDVVLGDFGVARMITSESQLTIDSSAPPLTPAYSPPEILRGEPGDATVDVWMLAATAAHLMVGERPFAWTTPPVDGAAVDVHVAALIDRLSDAGMPAPGLDAFRQAFSIDPTDRQRSCSDFSRALDLTLDQEASKPAPGDNETVPPDDTAGLISWEYRTGSGHRRGRAALVTVSLLLLVALASLVVWARSDDDADVAADASTAATPEGSFWVPGFGAALRVRASDLTITERVSVPSRGWIPTDAGVIGQQLELDPVALRLSDDSPTLTRVLMPPSGEAMFTTPLAAAPSGRYAWYHEKARVELNDLDSTEGVPTASPERLLLVDFDEGTVTHVEDLAAGSGVDTLWDPVALDDAALLFWQKNPDSFTPQLTRLEQDGTKSSSLDAPVNGDLVAAGATIWVAGLDDTGTVDPVRPRVTEAGPSTRQIDSDRVGQLPAIGLDDGSLATGALDSSLLAVRISHPDGSTTDHVHDWEEGEAPVVSFLDGVATGRVLWWPTEGYGSLFRLDTETGDFSRVELPEWNATNDVGWELTTAASGVVAQRADLAHFVDEQGEVKTIGAVTSERYWLYGSLDSAPEQQAVLVSDLDDGTWTSVSGDGSRVVRDPGERLSDAEIVGSEAWGLTASGALITFPMNGTGPPTTVIDSGLSGYLDVSDGLLVAADREEQIIYVVRTADGRVTERLTLDPDAGPVLPPSPQLHLAGGSVWWAAEAGTHRVDLTTRAVGTIDVGESITDVIEVDGEVWGATPTSLVRLDPSSDSFERFEIPGATGGFAVVRESAGRVLWVSTRDFIAASVDPSAPTAVFAFQLPEATVALAFSAGDIWVTDSETLRRISGIDGTEVASIDLQGISMVRSGGGAIWAIRDSDGELLRIDPESNSVERRYPLEE